MEKLVMMFYFRVGNDQAIEKVSSRVVCIIRAAAGCKGLLLISLSVANQVGQRPASIATFRRKDAASDAVGCVRLAFLVDVGIEER